MNCNKCEKVYYLFLGARDSYSLSAEKFVTLHDRSKLALVAYLHSSSTLAWRSPYWRWAKISIGDNFSILNRLFWMNPRVLQEQLKELRDKYAHLLKENSELKALCDKLDAQQAEIKVW